MLSLVDLGARFLPIQKQLQKSRSRLLEIVLDEKNDFRINVTYLHNWGNFKRRKPCLDTIGVILRGENPVS